MAKRLLLADDDRLVLATMGQGLRDAGYEILEATDGEAAVRLCESEGPDLAILDMRMPGMTGVEAAHYIREKTDVPFMFLSAYGDKEVVQLAVEEGALGYLVKPLDIPQLVPSIEAALARADELRRLRKTEHDLTNALEGGRETSMAIGLIMERYRLTRQTAFEALRFHARSKRRKLVTVASEFLDSAESLCLSPDVLKRAEGVKSTGS
ncbi:MAG: response regulator [Gammaproteobacteria bacterium]